MDINSTAPSFREVLLARNIVSDSVSNNGLEALTYGIGSFVTIGSTTPNVHPSADLELIGELYRDLMIVNNRHQGTLDDYHKVSIVNNPYGYETGLGVYNSNQADLISNNALYSDINILKNKYKQLLGERQVIDIKLINPLSPSDGEYTYGSAKLGIDDSSKQYRKDNVVKSKYLDFDAQLLRDIITTPVVTDKNLPNYMTRMVGIVGNGEGSVTTAASNIIGSILGGTQPSNSVGGTNPILGIGGALANSNIDETPLGIAAAQGLNNAIGYNIGANLYEETLGNINTNPLSVMMGNSIIVPNYSITVAKGTFGGLLDYAEKILGFQTPVSLLAQSSSIFQSENPVPNIQRANSMIANTGKGQVLSLFANMRASLLSTNNIKSGYAPSFFDERDQNGGINGNIYAFGDGEGGVIDLLHGEDNNPISQSNYNDGLAAASGFKDLANAQSTNIDGSSDLVGFTWSDPNAGVFTNTSFDKKSILYKTQYLFTETNKMINLNTKKFAKEKQGEINTTVDSAAGSVISKGSAVRKFNGRVPETDPTKMFNRAWTTFDRYDRVENLQKSSGLNPKAGTNLRRNLENSVLDSNGFVKIGPYGIEGDDEILGNPNLRNYMFSIENLAWADVAPTRLIPSEIGPGDTLTGKKGRIMWFPPYEMNFNDNTNVNWEATDFIGRGEPIYTYNNTTRTGTLQFKIIIDHPSYLNNLKGESDALIDSFFAGEFEVDDRVRSKLTYDEMNTLEVATNNNIDTVNQTPTTLPTDYTVYFPYNTGTIAPINLDYESSDGGATFNFVTNPMGTGFGLGTYTDLDNISRVDNTNYTLNDLYWQNIGDLPDKLKECIGCKVTITTYGVEGENSQARSSRQATQLDFLKGANDPNDPVKNKRYVLVDGGNLPVQLVDPITSLPLSTATSNVKQAIKVSVAFTWDSKLAEDVNPQKKVYNNIQPQTVLNAGIKNRFYNEIGFFKKLQQEDKVVYDSISEKIGFFHPAFHSITPEGFNARLTFLQQCTRQGPTLNDNFRSPDNLAFGRPPVCILRIGDFYHTKIVIDNMSFTYEPLVWDLNPEGIGVQPMIATVDMQFSFIGGSSLNGPINRLQNAVSFNFFANSEVYDPRADSISVSNSSTTSWINGPGEIVNGTYPDESGKAGASTNQGGNTNQADPSQTAAAAATVASGTPPVATPTNPDVNTITNSVIPISSWIDGNLTISVKDLVLNNDWGVKVSVGVDNQKVEIKTFPSISQLIDGDGRLTLDTGVTKNRAGTFTQEMSWSRNSSVIIPYFTYFLDFHRDKEATISKGGRTYLANCTNSDQEYYDIMVDEHNAGVVACECQNGGTCPY
jgi:hypothetical protein